MAIAGGQSLLAGLNMRLSAPKLLVDIGDLKELRGQSTPNGVVRLGALTRHGELLSSDLVREHLPAAGAGGAAHRPRRDPQPRHARRQPRLRRSGGRIAGLRGRARRDAGAGAQPRGEREVKAEDFFKGLFETDSAPGRTDRRGRISGDACGDAPSGFAELSRRHGDFALVGLAAVAVIADEPHRRGAARLFRLRRPRQGGASGLAAAVAALRAPLADTSAFEQAIQHDLAPDDTPGLRADTRLTWRRC